MSNGSEPAYPTNPHKQLHNHTCAISGGLTKRELIAAMCLQGILSNSEFLKNHKDTDMHKIAVSNADWLLSELSSNKESGE